jgi:Cu+-exporting ATPase
MTEGRPRVVAVVRHRFCELGFWRSASLERSSEHPLAAAIVAAARPKYRTAGRSGVHVGDRQGRDWQGGGHAVGVGTIKLLADQAVRAELNSRADAHRRDGATVMFVTIDGKAAGIIAVADPIKATTEAALDSLRANGIKIVMLTGDNRLTAQAVATKLGITDIEAEVLPEQENACAPPAERRTRQAMAGDGVNDAPAPCRGRYWCRHGHGTDVAMQSAGSRWSKATSPASHMPDLEPRHHAQYPAEPRPCLRLQCPSVPVAAGILSGVRHPAQSGDRGRAMSLSSFP